MTLPKETIDAIQADAKMRTGFSEDNDHKPYDKGMYHGFISGAAIYTDKVATEWAGKAQPVVDALEAFILWQGPTLKNWPVMQEAINALAKYKEVGNG
jgi:hypothetical protein